MTFSFTGGTINPTPTPLGTDDEGLPEEHCEVCGGYRYDVADGTPCLACGGSGVQSHIPSYNRPARRHPSQGEGDSDGLGLEPCAEYPCGLPAGWPGVFRP